MRKLNVVHVITLLELGGAQQNTLFTVQNLRRDRFNVGLVCGEGGFLDAEAKKTPNLDLRFARHLVRPVRPWHDLLAIWELKKIFEEMKPDVVHTHSSKAGIVARIAARWAKVPRIVHSIHGFGFNPYQKFFVRALFVWLEKITAPFTHKLIAVSQRNIEEGLALKIGHRSQYALIRSGVDIPRIRERAQASDPRKIRKELGVPEGAKMALQIGPYKFQKDPVSFVRLAGKVSKTVPDAKFVMVGDGELKPRIVEEIRALGLENSVILAGWRRDVPELLNACDLFVLTSLWEGLPRAGVEALIVGKPVVAFGVDGIPEIVKDGENGYVFKPGQLDEMDRAVTQVLTDESLRRRLAQNALKTIDDSFDIHRMVVQQEELYDQLLPGEGPSLTNAPGIVKMA